MRFSVGLLVILLVAVAIGVVAAHQQPTTTAAPAPTATPLPTPLPRANTVYMLAGGSNGSGIYQPSTLTVRVRQKVTWINEDTQDHTATADNGAFNTDVLTPGQKGTWIPKSPGTYTYSDYLHSTMQGTIVVKP
jgi:plastocyanin